MEPIKFKQANKTLLKPENMTDEECGSLHVYTDGYVCTSCWKPSIRERISFLFFGKLWVHVMSGETQPPIAVDVAKEIFGVVKKAEELSE